MVMTLLNPGDRFPALPLTPPGGATITLPDALAGEFGVVLFYRGSWCPYCNAQLRAFQRATGKLAEAGAKVVALSVDDEATTRELIAKHGLTFPVGHSADARAVAGATGRSSTTTRSSCNPPASFSTRPGASWSASTPAGPSDG
jgi:peroxiredoxin